MIFDNTTSIRFNVTQSVEDGPYVVWMRDSDSGNQVMVSVTNSQDEAKFVQECWERWTGMWLNVENKYNELARIIDPLLAMEQAWFSHGSSQDGQSCGSA